MQVCTKHKHILKRFGYQSEMIWTYILDFTKGIYAYSQVIYKPTKFTNIFLENIAKLKKIKITDTFPPEDDYY